MYPSSGYGQQSKYFDEDLLIDGTYQITSVTLHSSSRDLSSPVDETILRSGLLLTLSSTYPGFYVPLDTSDGYLNGNTPTQYMSDVVVLAREEHIAYGYISGQKRLRDITPANRIVPAYFTCSIRENKVYYNNMSSVILTAAQWDKCDRIIVIPITFKKYENAETEVRALLWNRKETFNTELKIN